MSLFRIHHFCSRYVHIFAFPPDEAKLDMDGEGVRTRSGLVIEEVQGDPRMEGSGALHDSKAT